MTDITQSCCRVGTKEVGEGGEEISLVARLAVVRLLDQQIQAHSIIVPSLRLGHYTFRFLKQ